ncbi:MAG: hypothetical protein N2561_06305 [Bacteroidetes bacterium]|nr:hypothetical protein [Rhodothermia bacterium]MCS7154711.1 hypothetical protein [Bacteroidota bacterium]MCX7907132.1 hypothetical protein [Bacteroidota bacterium]MDW8137504.1 hypothetical protein [Bacteroidota bacterium]MDW8285542.1 hypothetical protein [Bacteroidota bacterium]
MRPYAVPEGYFESLPARIWSRIQKRTQQRRRRRWIAVASLLVGGLGMVFLLRWRTDSAWSAEDVWALQLLHTGYDAALLWLDPTFANPEPDYPFPEPPHWNGLNTE